MATDIKSPYYKLQAEVSLEQQEWDCNIEYNKGDIVVFNNIIYKSLVNNNKNQIPGSSINWNSML